MTAFDADLVVVGLGPAGVACCVQGARAGLAVLGLDDALEGGLVGAANRIENLPLFPDGIDGPALARRLVQSLRRPGVETRCARAEAIERDPGGGYAVHLLGATPVVQAPSVCVATGTEPVPLPAWLAPSTVEGRSGRAAPVVRDARALPAGLDARRLAVVGGGDAAFDTALGLARRGARVAVLVRGRKARAAAPLQAQVAQRPEVEVRLGWEAAAPPEPAGERYRLVGCDGTALEVDAVVACLGRVPCLGLIAGLSIRDDAPPWSPLPGLFVAGDVRRTEGRFIAPALADGLRAADAAAAFLRGGCVP